MKMALSVWLYLAAIAVGVIVGVSPATQDAPDKSTLTYQYEYFRIDDTDQEWKCWTDGYRPSKTNSSKFRESGSGTAEDLQRFLRFNQSSTVLFMLSIMSDSEHFFSRFTVEANKLFRLSLYNVGLEKLELSFPGTENDCRLIDLSIPNNLLKEVPVGLDRLTALVKLDFSDNELESFNLNLLTKATDLETLLLNHNRLESVLSTEPITLGSLKKLDLSNNRLRTLDATSWNMPQLKMFHLEHNRHLEFITGWSRSRFPLVKGFDPTGTNNWNHTWLKTVQS